MHSWYPKGLDLGSQFTSFLGKWTLSYTCAKDSIVSQSCTGVYYLLHTTMSMWVGCYTLSDSRKVALNQHWPMLIACRNHLALEPQAPLCLFTRCQPALPQPPLRGLRLGSAGDMPRVSDLAPMSSVHPVSGLLVNPWCTLHNQSITVGGRINTEN